MFFFFVVVNQISQTCGLKNGTVLHDLGTVFSMIMDKLFRDIECLSVYIELELDF